MIVEIECLPDPPGTAGNRYAHVEAAIALIQQSGLNYQVGALGTTFEGPPERVWPLMRAVHEACLAAGAGSLVSVIKIAQSAGEGPTMEGLAGKFQRP
jgi:uncharacterized protein YqgV (UPF0045/DUF77 family)